MTWMLNEFSLRFDARKMVFSYVELEALSGESTTFNSKSYKNPGHAINAAKTWALLFDKKLSKVTVYNPDIVTDRMMVESDMEVEYRDEEFEGQWEEQKGKEEGAGNG